MLCNIAQSGIGYKRNLFDVPVMVSGEAEVCHHCSKIFPSGEGRGINDEAVQSTGFLNVWVDRIRELHEVVFSSAAFGCTYKMECTVSRVCSIMNYSFPSEYAYYLAFIRCAQHGV